MPPDPQAAAGAATCAPTSEAGDRQGPETVPAPQDEPAAMPQQADQAAHVIERNDDPWRLKRVFRLQWSPFTRETIATS